MATVIKLPRIRYRGFEITSHYGHQYVYVLGTNQCVWNDSDVYKCKKWIDTQYKNAAARIESYPFYPLMQRVSTTSEKS